jgi:glycosyl transferase family 25
MKSISDIKHVFYINLLSRPDRKHFVENQLRTIDITAERFNAVKMDNGAVGCSLSHLKIIEMAKQNDWDHVMIVEDDIFFTNPALFKQQLNAFLSNHDDYDVILLAGNNFPPYKPIDNTCVKVSRCQTTTGYIVKKHYYDKLIENFRGGIMNLVKEPQQRSNYAIDMYWFKLQEKDNWYLIIPLTVTQKENYSDIELRQTNYTSAMLDLDKSAFMKRQLEYMRLFGGTHV